MFARIVHTREASSTKLHITHDVCVQYEASGAAFVQLKLRDFYRGVPTRIVHIVVPILLANDSCGFTTLSWSSWLGDGRYTRINVCEEAIENGRERKKKKRQKATKRERKRDAVSFLLDSVYRCRCSPGPTLWLMLGLQLIEVHRKKKRERKSDPIRNKPSAILNCRFHWRPFLSFFLSFFSLFSIRIRRNVPRCTYIDNSREPLPFGLILGKDSVCDGNSNIDPH